MKKFLIFPIFLLGLFPISNLEASQSELKKDIRNWFRNDYWMYEKYSDILNTFCQVQKENSKNPKDIDCNSKKSAAIEQYDSDFHRKRECQNFIETNFKSIKKSEIREEIISDCKRIYYTYKDDEKFDNERFSSLWVAFVLNKKLPFYEGDYVNGKMEGFGKFYLSSGKFYIGEFKNGKMHGKGVVQYENGDKYEGDWVDSSRNGFGTATYSNGTKYVGQWSDSRVNGKGIMYNDYGEIYKEGIWRNWKLIKSQKINLKELRASVKQKNPSNGNSHEDCLKASDYQGCMNYKSGVVNTDRNNSGSGNFKNDNFKKTDCIDYICRPEDALKYGTDNLGMAVIPGYSFIDDPAERTANYFGSPLKLNVNGNFGRYVHIQRIVRYYSKGRSGYINSIRGISPGSYPTIIYRSGEAPGVRQTLIHNVFDCEDKTYARFNGNKSERIMEISDKSGKYKKKWLSFDDVAPGFTFNKGKDACNRSKNYIMSLKVSPFTKFEKKAPKSSLKKINSNVNCNSPIWRDKPRCN